MALAAVLQLTASLVGVAVLDRAGSTSVAPPRIAAPADVRGAPAPAPDPRTEREQAVRALLAKRADAVLSRDREAFLATVSPTVPAFLERQTR